MTSHSREPSGSDHPVYLIVNADDFGYGVAVSRGIIRAIQAGVVTATAILANAPRLNEQLQLLFEAAPDVDLGVHLNLTFGRPLSTHLEAHTGGERFPARNALLAGILTRRIPTAAIEAEWRCQIERCLEAGIRPRFLNSHEHVHMVPSLYALAHRLAVSYGIPNVRRVTPDQFPNSFASLFRVSIMTLLAGINRPVFPGPEPRLLGLARSGRLDSRYYRRRFPTLKKGSYYELMCHPGYFDAEEISDPRLLRYHAWESELNALLDPSFLPLCSRHGIRLIGFRDLERVGSRTQEDAA